MNQVKGKTRKARARKTGILSFAATTILLLVGAQTCASLPAGAQQTLPRDKWALVIGISKFKNPKLNLKQAARDAADFAAYLVDEGHFAADHVKVLLDEEATQRNILSSLGSQWLGRRAAPDDLAVVYISTHGSAAEAGQGLNFLLAADSDSDDLYATGIEMQQIARVIKAKVYSKRVVIIVDACHAGGATAAGADKAAKATSNINAGQLATESGQLVIASSQPNQESFEFKARENGVFTGCLLDALRKGGVKASLADIFKETKEQVQAIVLRERGVLQTPVLASSWPAAEIALAVPPQAPRPGLTEESQKQADEPKLKQSEETKPKQQASDNAERPPKNGPVDKLLDDIQPDLIKLPEEKEEEEPQAKQRRAKTLTLPDRLALLPCTAPPRLSLGSDYINDPAVNLQYMLQTKLRSSLGRKLVSSFDSGEAMGNAVLTGTQFFEQENLMMLGRAMKARYIAEVSIEDLAFIKDTCRMEVILRVGSGETGELILVEGKRVNTPPFKGGKNERMEFLKGQVYPALTEALSERILEVMQAK